MYSLLESYDERFVHCVGVADSATVQSETRQINRFSILPNAVSCEDIQEMAIDVLRRPIPTIKAVCRVITIL
jgi:hypothetical protein